MRGSLTILLALAVCGIAAAQPADRGGNAAPRPVLVLPLKGVGDVGTSGWIGQAVQQNVVNELGRTAGVKMLAPATQPVEQPEAAIAAGRAAGAALVLYGSYQINQRELRIAVQLIETPAGTAVGAAKATGPMRDLFGLEDSVAGQVRRMVEVRPPAVAEKKFEPVIPQRVREIAGKVVGEAPAWPWDVNGGGDWVRRNWPEPDTTDLGYYRGWYRYNSTPGWYGYYPYYGWATPYYRSYYYGSSLRYNGYVPLRQGYLGFQGGY